jgi:pimeloyl-ACP methyl ester carboxylesterase
MDTGKPVLLWLDDGPALSMLPWTSTYNKELANHSILLLWDQRGTGKSYHAVKDWWHTKIDDYVKDVIGLSEYLIDRFKQPRIFLLGQGWGTVIGLKAVYQRPDLYHAYVGIAQRVQGVENDQMSYQLLVKKVKMTHNKKLVNKLAKMGPPPYPTSTPKRYKYLFRQVQNVLIEREITPREPLGFRFCRQYSFIDTIHLYRGYNKGLKYIYPQLHDLNFESTLKTIDVPVHFAMGRYDFISVQVLAERYFHMLKSPKKTFVWFEKSGHYPCYQEAEKFNLLIKQIIQQ